MEPARKRREPLAGHTQSAESEEDFRSALTPPWEAHTVWVVNPPSQGSVESSTEPDHGWHARSRWICSFTLQHGWERRGDGSTRSFVRLLRHAAL